MNDTPEKESKTIKDSDKFMTITVFAWNEKVEKIKSLQIRNKKLVEALENIKEEEWRLAGEFTTIYLEAYHALLEE